MKKENTITIPSTVSPSPAPEKDAGILTAMRAKVKRVALAVTTFYAMSVITAITAFAEAAGTDSVDPDKSFYELVGFFAKWIGRIGLVIAFVGAVMFGMGMKNEDADSKTRGLNTFAAGFIVYALTRSLNLFGIETGFI